MNQTAKRRSGTRLLSFLLVLAVVLSPIPASAATTEVLHQGTVVLSPTGTFSVAAYNSGTSYEVNEATPLGALRAAGIASGFFFDVTDKNYSSSGALLLDNIGSYAYVKGGSKWYAYVNDTFQDGYMNAAGALNLIALSSGDRVEFYFAAGIDDATDLVAVKAAATAAVKTVASVGTTPIPADPDWTLQLGGAKTTTVTRAYFQDGLACSGSGHSVTWTDTEGDVWGGVPLWLLVGMVDDDPDVGTDHFNFNDTLSASNYKVTVVAGDGWSATFESSAIARSSGYIVANTLNGEPLPAKTTSDKDSWPLHLKGSAVFGGQQVGNIVRIELTDMPAVAEGWTLELAGEVGDTVTQAEFETVLAATTSEYFREWTDSTGAVWSGVPLWVLASAVDDIESGNSWTFNQDLAEAGYTIKVEAKDGFSRTFESAAVADSDAYIVANRVDGEALSERWPLRLVGTGVTKDDGTLGGSAVGEIAKITIPEFVTPAATAGSYNLTLTGKITDTFSQAEFEAGLACPGSGHMVEWTDGNGDVWSGMPLWFLAGWVDDREPHSFNFPQSQAGYTVLVKAGDGYTKEFASADIANSSSYIVANLVNGQALTTSGPLRLVGSGVAKADGTLGGTSVGSIAEIELIEFGTAVPVPQVRIIKYGPDQTSVTSERTVDYLWMESNLPVIGDGVTRYRYEGITNNPADVWDEAETYPGGFKIDNAVKGSLVRDLVELVGGMGTGTEIVFVADDGYETRLPYSSIYPDPAVLARQGETILAWWGDGEYVPAYRDGMRVFFTPGGDHIYGQWDMHETLPEKYWHFYGAENVQYPSCAGLSAKYITEIRVYSVPVADWTLELDGTSVGGFAEDINKTYFEQALACQFGAEHKATYTDSKGRVWEGMPLWFLAGMVDDTDRHTDEAFNEALAGAGYRVEITATDGYWVSIDSQNIIRNANYIVANALNATTMAEGDGNWPLRLVGPSVSGSASISQIESIRLVAIPALSDTNGHWAQENIQAMVRSGAVNGYPDGTFNPDGTITRAEFVTMLVRAAKLTSQGSAAFADTTGHWAWGPISVAASLGVVNGYTANTFGPNDPISRAQMATMLVRALELELVTGSTQFSDSGSISEWARQYIATAVEAGIIAGYPDNSLRPQGPATRAEALTAIMNALAK